MTSISSLPAFGPEAKNTAGSPGSTRISRNVKTSTPNSAGREDMKRLPARTIVAPRLFTTNSSSRQATFHDGRRLFAIEIAIIDLAVELVGIAVDRRCHDSVLTGLPERNLRHFREMDCVELQAVLVVLGLIRLEPGFLGDRSQLVIFDAAVVPALIAGI